MYEILLWHGFNDSVTQSLTGIVDEWNQEQEIKELLQKEALHPALSPSQEIPSDKFYRISAQQLKGAYHQAAENCLSISEEERPALIAAPEYMTQTLLNALEKHKIIPAHELIDKKTLEKIPLLVKKTFSNTTADFAALPFNPSCGVLYINKDLLKKIGYDPSFSPQSLEEIKEVYTHAVEKNIDIKGYTTAWPAAYLIEVPLAQNNQPIALPDNGKLGYGEYQLSKSRLLKEHLQELRQEAKTGIYLYAGETDDAATPFLEGKAVFFMQGSSHFELLKKRAPFELGVAPLPTLTLDQNRNYAFPLGGTCIWTLNTAKTQKMIDGVREFLNYIASEKVQEKLHRDIASVPCNIDIPEKLTDFYSTHPLHKAVIAQTLKAQQGEFSYGIHMPNYPQARLELMQLIKTTLVNPESTENEALQALKEFDKKQSIDHQ